jgi:hypothetical protein
MRSLASTSEPHAEAIQFVYTLDHIDDMNNGDGIKKMELLNDIHAEYAGKVDFLVAHLGMADGQAFANNHGASDGTVMLFTGDGTPGGKLYHPDSVDALHQALNSVLALER